MVLRESGKRLAFVPQEVMYFLAYPVVSATGSVDCVGVMIIAIIDCIMPESSPLPEENLHELSQERHVLRDALRNAGAIPLVVAVAHEGIVAINEKLVDWSIKGEGGLTLAKERLRADRTRSEADTSPFRDDAAIATSLGAHAPAFQAIEARADLLDETRDFTMRQLRRMKDPRQNAVHERLFAAANEEHKRLAIELRELKKEHPEEYRAHELIRYRDGLYEEGHIAPTPSVDAHLERIGRNMLLGKPMFLHGPTGTGKTSLARYAAQHFTGSSAEMVYCNPQTRESSVWGKTGIRPTEGGGIETIDVFGPLARAMQEGRVVIFDEFSALPKEQMVFIKGIFNAKPGDEVNVVGNGKITIAEGFQMIFTANLKSEKNKERQDLPPEITREFEPNNLKINYQPKEETYDIMLARMMNPDGSVDASLGTLNDTLPKLAEAIEEIQIAYTGTLTKDTARLAGALDASGKTKGLEKFVMTQGTIEAMLADWKIEQTMGETKPFVAHIDERLKIALTFEEYPLADRILAAKILASKGFLRTQTPEALGLPADVFKATVRPKDEKTSVAGGTREKEQNIPLIELAGLDPFGVRRSKVMTKAAGILDATKEETPASEKDPLDLGSVKETNEPFLKETFEKWYGANSAQIEQMPIIVSPEDQDFAALGKDINKAKFGEYIVNPEMANVDWENIPPEKIKIPDLSAWNGKPLHEVAQHIVDTYSNTHHIPGIEFWKWIIEEYDNASPDVKEKYKTLADGKYYFNFGSLLRRSDGYWDVPYAHRDGSGWYRYADWLGSGWYGDYRVLLLEK